MAQMDYTNEEQVSTELVNYNSLKANLKQKMEEWEKAVEILG